MIRLRAEDESGQMKKWEVSGEEFEYMLETGNPDPDLEVCSDNLTQGQWERLGEMTLYKKAMAEREIASAPWTCRSCATENPPQNKSCSNCTAPKPVDNQAEDSGQDSETDTDESAPQQAVLRDMAEEEGIGWVCSSCGSPNPPGRGNCACCLAARPMWTCGNCGRDNEEHLEHCQHCNTSREAARKTEPAAPAGANQFCESCGTQLTPGAKFCGSCGSKAVSHQRSSSGKGYAIPTGAIVAAICFFLPWFRISCGSSISVRSGVDFAQADNAYWLILLAALAIIGFYFYFRSQGNMKKVIGSTLICAGTALLLMAYKLGTLYDKMMKSTGEYGLEVTPQIGIIGLVLGFIVSFLGAFFVPSSES